MIKLCVFDFDSTLMDGETINILATAYGVGEATSAITRRAMDGELDFFESLTQRVALLKGMPYQQVLDICSNLPLMQGSFELIDYLKSKNIKVVVFSGGFHEGMTFAREKLGFDAGFANSLHHKDGLLSGLVAGEMMFSSSKGFMLQRLKRILKLETKEVACIGDGANDISMFKESGLKIAFCAKEILRSYANVCIDTKDMKEIIRVFK